MTKQTQEKMRHSRSGRRTGGGGEARHGEEGTSDHLLVGKHNLCDDKVRQIYVKTCASKTIILLVLPRDTNDKLRRGGLPLCSHVHDIFEGNVLRDCDVAKDCGTNDGSIVQMVERSVEDQVHPRDN